MDIRRLLDSSAKEYPKKRGMVAFSAMEFFDNEARLTLEIEGEYFLFKSGSGVPTIRVGEEVIIHLKNEEGPTILGIQVVEAGHCILCAANKYGWEI